MYTLPQPLLLPHKCSNFKAGQCTSDTMSILNKLHSGCNNLMFGECAFNSFVAMIKHTIAFYDTYCYTKFVQCKPMIDSKRENTILHEQNKLIQSKLSQTESDYKQSTLKIDSETHKHQSETSKLQTQIKTLEETIVFITNEHKKELDLVVSNTNQLKQENDQLSEQILLLKDKVLAIRNLVVENNRLEREVSEKDNQINLLRLKLEQTTSLVADQSIDRSLPPPSYTP